MAFTGPVKTGAIAGCLAVAIVALGSFAHSTQARAESTGPISVNVDGNPIVFSGTQPIEVHGSVLVPLRGVFESLGADVEYDGQTQTVMATKGDRTVVVPIGSSTATINGQPEKLTQPAEIYGSSTMVPLRFVAEAFGDYVEWADQTHMVSITTVQPSLNVAAIPPPPVAEDMTTYNGVVRQVIADSDPRQIIVRVNGVDREFPISGNATVLRGRVGRDGEMVALRDVQPGDRVAIRCADDGSAVRIASSYGLIYGTVSAVETKDNGRSIIQLDDGQNVVLASGVRVMRDGESIAPADLNTGDHVTISTDPVDNVAYRVNVNPPIYAHRR